MKKVYFAGSIRGGRDDQELYQSLITEIGKYATVLTEHIGKKNLEMGETNLTDSYIYERDMEWIREADLIIAEVSTPSLGVGYEIGQAEAMGKRVVGLFRPQEGKRVSAMIAGNKNIQLFEYSDLDSARKALAEIFIM